MATVIYKGDHAEVVVPITASVSVTCKWGESVEVPGKVAASLLESSAWVKAGNKPDKKTVAEAAETTTVAAVVDKDNDKVKGGN
jgi:hypothetical protein